MSSILITAVVNGATVTLGKIDLPAGLANGGDSFYVSFDNPIKVDPNTAITLTAAFDAAHATITSTGVVHVKEETKY